MKKQYDFFLLRYPPPVAEVCRFFQIKNGKFFDFPFVLPYDCKTVEYEKANIIIYEEAKYLKLNEMSRVTIQMPLREKRFCWGVINISSEKKMSFLFWININGDAEDIVDYFLGKQNFYLIREGTNESFTILWSA